MKEFKGTRGNVNMMSGSIPNMIQIYATNENLEMICKVYKDGILHNYDQDYEANANLIVDAFKVRQQINYELSELLEQRNEMLDALKVCYSSLCTYGDHPIIEKQVEHIFKKVKDNG